MLFAIMPDVFKASELELCDSYLIANHGFKRQK
jgi:hypothetical protein